MYTVKDFEIAKPANVVFSNFRLKNHNVLYALGYSFKAGSWENYQFFGMTREKLSVVI